LKLDGSLPELMTGMLDRRNLTVFLFHGVIKRNESDVRNYNGKHITQDLFHRCMQTLAGKGVSLSMDEVCDYLKDGSDFPANSYAVTFDDGFENNISIAAPILEELKIPATIYITTDFIDSNTMSWADRLDYMIDQTREKTMILPWEDSAIPIRENAEKIEALKLMRAYIKSTPGLNLEQLINEIAVTLKTEPVSNSDDPLDLKMSWEQVRQAVNNELLIIGGHSHTHPILSFLDDSELEYEIQTSVEMMYEKGRVKPDHYSYPEGLSHCFNSRVINNLKGYGVRCCPTAISGNNSSGTNPFYIRREMIINR